MVWLSHSFGTQWNQQALFPIKEFDRMTAAGTNSTGLRAVAVFEAVKSIAILVVGFGLLSLINRDVAKSAESLIRHLHLNPANRYPHIFIETARHLTNVQLWLFASLAFFDSLVRLVVAYGLWHNRKWGKWLGVVTAGIYIPLEIYEIFAHLTGLKLLTFITNIAIVVYLGLDLYWSKNERRAWSSAVVGKLPEPDCA